MKVVSDGEVVAYLSYFGEDTDGLLKLVFGEVNHRPDPSTAGSESGSRNGARINIQRFSALTLLGRAGILAEIVGTRDDVLAAKTSLEAMAKTRGEFAEIAIVHVEDRAPARYANYLPFPLRLTVLAPDSPGVLTSLCEYLYSKEIKVIACRGELYEPRQSPVDTKSAADLRLTLLLPRREDWNRSDLELALDARSRVEGWLDWSLEPLR